MLLVMISFLILGAFLYRLRGASWEVKRLLPKPVPQILFVIPYAMIVFSWWSVVILVISTLAVSTGHGGFQDLGRWTLPRSDEKLEFLIKSLKSKLEPYWYDSLGLALTGFAVTLVPGIAIMVTGNLLSGLLLALSGMLKAPSYMLGWKVYKGNSAGEWIFGAFAYASLELVMLTLS